MTSGTVTSGTSVAVIGAILIAPGGDLTRPPPFAKNAREGLAWPLSLSHAERRLTSAGVCWFLSRQQWEGR